MLREAQWVVGVNSIHPLRAMPIGKPFLVGIHERID